MDKYGFSLGNEEASLLTQNQLDIFLDAAYPLPEDFEAQKAEALTRLTDVQDDSTFSLYSLDGSPITYRGTKLEDDELPVIVSLALEKVLHKALGSSRDGKSA